MIPLQATPLAVIPAAPALPAPNTQPNLQNSALPAQSMDLQEIKGILQTFSNEIVNMKK